MITSQLESRPQAGGFERFRLFLERRALAVRWASVVLILIAVVLLMRTLPVERALGLVQSKVDGLGIWGAVIFGLLYVMATVLFIPGTILTLAIGALYGLVLGTVIVSFGSTTGAALAFLIARYVARDRVRRNVEQSPKLAAVDKAIGEEGWKIVALLRLSPAIPFNLQNYLYGVTSIRFWPYVLTSWLAMLPGTFMYVYIGSLGKTAASGGETGLAEWAIRGIGFLATVVVTVYIARLAWNAIQQRTDIEAGHEREDEQGTTEPSGIRDDGGQRPPWRTLVTAVFAIAMLATAAWAHARKDLVRNSVERLLGAPPTVNAVEAYEIKPDGPTFDHSTYDALLRRHVDPDGWVDYRGLRQDAAMLDEYLEQLTAAPFDSLGRNEKLALLINAYNAFTLRLILDHQPLESIQDIPGNQRWDAERWQVGTHVWSLSQIEHEQIRPNFREPRVHFALVCAAIGCPPLRNEAYTGERLEHQLAAQTDYVHSHSRWYRFDPQRNVVHLTKLYDWYRSDFTQEAASVLEYAATHVAELSRTLKSGPESSVRWLEYDWRLNSKENEIR